jgi:hypothetical protein
MALSAQVRCLRWQPSAHRNPLQRVSDLMAVAAKFGTASDAERSLVFLTIINDLGLGYCFHLDEFELVVDDREELRDFVHTCLCFGSPQQPRKQIAGY